MKVLITDDVHELMISGLIKMGFRVDFHPKIILADLPKIISNYSGIIINSKIVMDKNLLDLAKDLKFIARLGSGLEIIDLEIAKQKNIAVFNAPEGNRNAVAEHALGMLLCASNNILKADREVKKLIWNRESNRGFELEHKIVGIIGFGNTGRAFAEKLKGFQVTVLAYDKYKSKYAADLPFVIESSFHEVITKSDIISLHLPLSTETKFLVNTKFITACKKGVILINTSRGDIINTVDLVAHLQNGHIGSACLDVFENEKPESYTDEETKLYTQLFSMNNVILSPHIAGWTVESKRKLSEVLLNKIDKWYTEIDAID